MGSCINSKEESGVSAAGDVGVDQKNNSCSSLPMPVSLSKPSAMEFNDTLIKISAMSSLRTTMNDSGLKHTLTFSTLEQVVDFKLGDELGCMSWNLNHEQECTPFEFYSDFRKLRLRERDVVCIEIIWDVARVFLHTKTPTELSKTTKLKTVIPRYLLTKETLDKFCDALKIDGGEKELVMKFPELSINEFLLALSYNEDMGRVLKDKGSFRKTHARFIDRASSALRQTYSPSAGESLIEKDPTILPVLILDTLHVLTIRFSEYLLHNDIQRAFSEYESDEQIKQLKAYCAENSPDDFALPKFFVKIRKILFEKWNSIFIADNILTQIARKIETSNIDIVLLQGIRKQLFRLLKKKMSDSYLVHPKEFPSNLTHSTVICLKRGTVTADWKNIRRIDELNFAIPCQASDINFFVGVLNLSPGKGCGGLRKKEVIRYKRMIGKDPAILGGNFNEDLCAIENPVSQIMQNRFNGIDHNESMPPACTTNPTRTNLQFNVAQSDQRDAIVDNGIYSTFPLVGDAWTDFLYPGKTNPSDRGPIFQRVRLALI